MLFIAALTAVPSAIAFVGIMIADYKATQKKKRETNTEQIESENEPIDEFKLVMRNSFKVSKLIVKDVNKKIIKPMFPTTLPVLLNGSLSMAGNSNCSC